MWDWACRHIRKIETKPAARRQNRMENYMAKSIRSGKRTFYRALYICLVVFTAVLAPRARAGVPAEKDLAAYLFVYFLDKDHSLHFALSSDGYSFTDVNHGEPVMKGEDIAEQKGIRDPHIVRGPDNAFYLS